MIGQPFPTELLPYSSLQQENIMGYYTAGQYLKHKIMDNIVVENYVVYRNTLFRGGVDESDLSETPIYNDNKTKILNIFPTKCIENENGMTCNGQDIIIQKDGYIDFFESDGGCNSFNAIIESDGSAFIGINNEC